MVAKKLLAAFPIFIFALTSVLFFGAPLAHAQILLGGGGYTSDLSFKEGGERYSSGGGTNLFLGYSPLPSLLIIPSLDVVLESDSFSRGGMSVEARSFGAEIGFGISVFEFYAKFAAGTAEIAHRKETGWISKGGRFMKERYGFELGLYFVNLFYEQGRISFGNHSDTPRLFGIKIRIPLG